MKPDPFDAPHDPRDPNPWLANYLDQSTPLDDAVKRAWPKIDQWLEGRSI